MSALPSITNASLTRVRDAGGSSDYDADASGGTDKWTGAQRVFWSEVADSAAVGTEVNVRVSRSLVVATALVVPWAIGDVVTVDRDGYQTEEAIVRHVQATRSPQVPGVVRLIMEDA